MRFHLAHAVVLAGLLAGACTPHAAGPAYVGAPDVPRTARPFNDDPEAFRFVVVGDRTGGHRPGVFEQALRQVEWLQPAFVISVGDQIEGYTEDRAEIDRQWDEIGGAIGALPVPFFHVAGNHDISNEVMRTLWRQRLGRDYYHFTYRGVLFIALNTEDPPGRSKRADLLAPYDRADVLRVFQALKGDPETAEALFRAEPKLGEIAAKTMATEAAHFSAEQVAYVRRALDENRDVRWTFVLMHRPAWRYDNAAFRQIEAMLQGRPYTMLAGHLHSYAYERRGEHDYIQMGTTGGTQEASRGPGLMDHVLWVTMTRAGPEFANIRLEGLLDRTGPQR